MEIIFEEDAPRLSRETGASIAKCIKALDECRDYEAAKRYLIQLDHLELNNVEGD